MLGYRRHVTVQDPQRLVLTDLPVKPGQQVEILILVKENTRVSNPAEVYTDAQWDKFEPDLRSEMETQYVLNNPILMKQLQDQSQWFRLPADQLGIDVEE